jgi:hypothetical protein
MQTLSSNFPDQDDIENIHDNLEGFIPVLIHSSLLISPDHCDAFMLLPARTPVTRLLLLMSDGIDLWPIGWAFFVDNRIGKAIEVVKPHSMIGPWPDLLISDEKINYAFVLSEECFRDELGRMRRVANGRLPQFLFRIGMNPEAHAIRARTRARASLPGRISTAPAFTSSRR